MERMDTVNIGEILRNSRESLGFTQEEIGERLIIALYVEKINFKS